jgi:hypothetical protein
LRNGWIKIVEMIKGSLYFSDCCDDVFFSLFSSDFSCYCHQIIAIAEVEASICWYECPVENSKSTKGRYLIQSGSKNSEASNFESILRVERAVQWQKEVSWNGGEV